MTLTDNFMNAIESKYNLGRRAIRNNENNAYFCKNMFIHTLPHANHSGMRGYCVFGDMIIEALECIKIK
jgi:hypothetical protein